MGSLGPIHWIVFFLIALTVWPIARLLRRTGRSEWWAVLYFVPFVNWIALWVWAFTLDRADSSALAGGASFRFNDEDDVEGS